MVANGGTGSGASEAAAAHSGAYLPASSARAESAAAALRITTAV